MAGPHPHRPRVSVILNCFNGAAFLRAAVDSVVRQTFTDWELVCWDDRSTDGSAGIILGYDDARIRYHLAPAHTPLGEARHLAIQAAQGEWLAFLDQDDLWAADKLERQIRVIDSESADLGLVYGRAIRFDLHGAVRDYDYHHEFQPLPEGVIFDDLVRQSNFIAMSSALVRRAAYDETGGIPPRFQVVPDYFMFLAVSRTWRTRALQEPCCWVRIHDANMSASTRLRSHEEALDLIETWRDALDPAVYARRVRIYHTLIGFEEMAHQGTALRGLARVIRRGSLPYLLTRPFARAGRRLRRRWRGSASPCPRPPR